MQTRTLSVCWSVLRRRFAAMFLLALVPAAAAVAAGSCGYGEHARQHWVATWSTALHGSEVAPGLGNTGFNNQTLRQVVHTSIGGRQVRVRLSAFGTGGFVVGAAHVALSAGGPAVVQGSDHLLRFGGKQSISVPPGAPVISDPVELFVPPLTDLAVTIFVPGVSGPATWHFDARQTSYVSPQGDFTNSGVMPLDPMTPTLPSWFWLAGVEVLAQEQAGVIAALVYDRRESSLDGLSSPAPADSAAFRQDGRAERRIGRQSVTSRRCRTERPGSVRARRA